MSVRALTAPSTQNCPASECVDTRNAFYVALTAKSKFLQWQPLLGDSILWDARWVLGPMLR